eukprot:gb/GECG01014220.1/.p1 GENE.gb/GECG01014220.1/~~gb/GECG01014220.1/.p1  ORF type:complete len:1041 (+),score=130.92 gb/GECG01014220.1/:1-3123(+)
MTSHQPKTCNTAPITPSNKGNFTPEECRRIARVMRVGVDIRDRFYRLRLHRTVFLAEDAVTWIVEQGYATTREGAVELGSALEKQNLLRVIGGSAATFCDKPAFCRFVADNDKHAKQFWTVPKLGATNGRSLGQYKLTWRFQPHIIHNSLLMRVESAEIIHIKFALLSGSLNACVRQKPPSEQLAYEIRQELLKLRDRFKNLASESSKWLLSKRRSGDRMKVYRLKNESELTMYPAYLTSATVQVPPYILAPFLCGSASSKDYIESHGEESHFVDENLGCRALWDPSCAKGKVIETYEWLRTDDEDLPSPAPRTREESNVFDGPLDASPSRTGDRRSVGERNSGEDQFPSPLEGSSIRYKEEELLHEKFAKFVHKHPHLNKWFGKLVNAPEYGNPTSEYTSSEGGRNSTSDTEAVTSQSATLDENPGEKSCVTCMNEAAAHVNDDVILPPPRILYRKMKPVSAFSSWRDTTVFQDCTRYEDGSIGVWEVSVQHRLIPPRKNHVRACVFVAGSLLTPITAAELNGDNPKSYPESPVVATRVSLLSQMSLNGQTPMWLGNAIVDGQTIAPMESLLKLVDDIIAVKKRRQQGLADSPAASDNEMGSPSSVPGQGYIRRNMSVREFEGREEQDEHESSPEAAEEDVKVGGIADSERNEEIDADNIRASSGDKRLTLDDFQILAVLGRGGYGKVLQVRHVHSGRTYAMKALKKKEVIRRKQVFRTLLERDILAIVKHPFIVDLRYTFQTPTKLYLVLEFVGGGDFFTLLSRYGTIEEERCKLYMAELVLALEHLHKNGVVYRDLKPENVLLDGEGHVKLTDFGLSRVGKENKRPEVTSLNEQSKAADERTHSFCGTEQYMAPEVLLQHGHSSAVDWWSLGIMMSEMLTGKHPFRGSSHLDTLRNMVNPSIQPKTLHLLSKNAKSLLEGLLAREPSKRLGSSDAGGVERIKKHAFFKNVDWANVYDKKYKPSFRPNMRGENDIANFEDTFTRQEARDSVASSVATEQLGITEEDFLGFFDEFAEQQAEQEKGSGRWNFPRFSYAAE